MIAESRTKSAGARRLKSITVTKSCKNEAVDRRVSIICALLWLSLLLACILFQLTMAPHMLIVCQHGTAVEGGHVVCAGAQFAAGVGRRALRKGKTEAAAGDVGLAVGRRAEALRLRRRITDRA
jgi:hypothetical protein